MKKRINFHNGFFLSFAKNKTSKNNQEYIKYTIRGIEVIKYPTKIQINGETCEESSLIKKVIESSTRIPLLNNAQ